MRNKQVSLKAMKRIIKQVFFGLVLMVALTGMKVKATSALLKPEIEPELELESWMIDESFWYQLPGELTPATDDALEIEAWMTEDSYWQ